MSRETLCDALRIETSEAEAIIGAFAAEGMIVNCVVANWEKRRFIDPRSADGPKSGVKGQLASAPEPKATSPKGAVTMVMCAGTSRDAPEQNRTEQNRTEQNEQIFPVGTTPDGAVDLKKLVFDRGVAVQMRKGTTEENARSFIGKCIAATSVGDTLEAIGRCEREDPADPRAFIRGILKSKIRRPEQQADAKQAKSAAKAHDADRMKAARAQCKAEGLHPLDGPGMLRVAEILREMGEAA